MPERVALIVYTFAFLLLFAAAGSGFAVMLVARSVRNAVLWAPILGACALAALLTTVMFFAPVGAVAWPFVVPLCVFSLAVAATRIPRDGTARSLDVGIGAAVTAVGAIVAALPGLLRGTLGPYGLKVDDAWAYVPYDAWLRAHSSRDAVTGAERHDLLALVGHYFVSGPYRMGADTLDTTGSALFGVPPDRTLYPCLCAVFALVPLSIWFVSRALGIPRAYALAGTAFGLSPAILMMVDDSTFPNLIALGALPPTLLLTVYGVLRGELRALVAAAILDAGLIATFPELLPPLVVSALVGGAVVLYVRRRTVDRAQLRTYAWRLVALAVAAPALTPYATARSWQYLENLRQGGLSEGLPPRFIHLDTFGAWATGFMHLYELPIWAVRTTPVRAAAIVVPIALGVVAVAGMWRARMHAGLFVAVPILVALGFGFWSRHEYSGGNCEYCMWKAFTFFLPFVAIGLGLGTSSIARFGRIAAVAAAAVMAVGVAGVVHSDVRLTEATYYNAGYVTPALRQVRPLLAKLPSGRVLIEGADQIDGNAPFSVPATYDYARGLRGLAVSVDAPPASTIYFGRKFQPYPPSYDYVLTTLGGIRSRRTMIAQSGKYAVMRRGKVDVVMSGGGWTIDADSNRPSTPWLTQPFTLRVVVPHPGRVSLRIGIAHPGDPRSTLQLSFQGTTRVLRPKTTRSGAECVSFVAHNSITSLQATPLFSSPIQPAGVQLTVLSLAPPRLPRLLGITSLFASYGGCR